MRFRQLRKHFLLGIGLGLLLFFALGLDQRMTVRHYRIETEKLDHPVRIVLVTDLHSCRYGDGQKELLDEIENQHPDVILLGGDIFDNRFPDQNTELFLAGIFDICPVFYVTGNHECWAEGSRFQKYIEILNSYGVKRLSGNSEILVAGGEKIRICGVDDPDITFVRNWDTERGFTDFQTQMRQLMQEEPDDKYTVLLTHRPELLEVYAAVGFDLVLAGHAHGGQWRIPGILNGLFAPEQGFFPKLAGGRYREKNTEMIVSRGLARESVSLPRFYNRPELVVIDLQ